MECGLGRPVYRSAGQNAVSYNGGVIRFEPQQGGAENYTWDTSAIVRQQHSGSATFSGPVAFNQTAWLTVNLSGQIIGAGHHGTGDYSYFMCGVALEGRERAGPFYQGSYYQSYADVPLSCSRFDRNVGTRPIDGQLIVNPDQVAIYSGGTITFAIPDSNTRYNDAERARQQGYPQTFPEVRQSEYPDGSRELFYRIHDYGGAPSVRIDVDPKGYVTRIIGESPTTSLSCTPK